MQAVEEGGGEERNARFEESDLDSEISKLRGRWELASVLNFLDVFGPILGKDLKLSAEDIEIGLVKPDTSLSRLHIQLLKGIPPVSKTLEDSDKWVTAPCKNLTAWWLCISKYKEPDPSDCLLLLKALCEVRAQQHGAVSYINDALKEGNQISTFRKDAIGRDGTDTSY
ncbi:DDT domain-containing protein DDR4 [Glycine max]|nr:DDT domain-containing protein DDR4 [Glycine max]